MGVGGGKRCEDRGRDGGMDDKTEVRLVPVGDKAVAVKNGESRLFRLKRGGGWRVVPEA